MTLVAALCVLLSACAAAGPAPASQAPATQASAIAPAPDCREVDASSPEWPAIGRRYARLARAIREKDLDAMAALYAPEFEVRESPAQGGGAAATREQSIALQRERLASVVQTQLISHSIVRLVSCGDRATATVLQQWFRTQRIGERVRRVETAAVQDEEWLRTPAGWLRGDISNVTPGAWLVDDKRIDPARPWREDAPPFEPFADPAVATVGHVTEARPCRPAEPDSPLWRTIGHGYWRIADAIRRRDVDDLLAVYAPVIETRLRDGTVWNTAQAQAYARAGIEQVRVTRLVSNTLLKLQDCGNRAIATVLQQWYRTQMFAGQVRRLETSAVQDEEWVSTPNGWMRGGVSNESSAAWLIDGKRVQPGRPFDPEAPWWEPFPEE